MEGDEDERASGLIAEDDDDVDPVADDSNESSAATSAQDGLDAQEGSDSQRACTSLRRVPSKTSEFGPDSPSSTTTRLELKILPVSNLSPEQVRQPCATDDAHSRLMQPWFHMWSA